MTEQLTHHEVFKKFATWRGAATRGYQHNFLGVRTNSAYDASMVPHEGAEIDAPFPPFDEGYFEWIDVLESVVSARGQFTMMELGAGFGRWLVNAAVALRACSGLPHILIGVEAESMHFEWMKLHLGDNGIDLSNCVLVNAVVGARDGEVLFHTGRSAEWYGQSVVKASDFIHGSKPGVVVRKLKTVGLSTLLGPLEVVDLVHVDVQGAELEVLQGATAELDRKVRRLHIGTHDRDVEAGLRLLIGGLGWERINDFQGEAVAGTPWGMIRFQDGLQTWINPKVGDQASFRAGQVEALRAALERSAEAAAAQDAYETPQVATALEQHVHDAPGILEPLFQAVNASHEFAFQDWVMLYSVAMQYRPSVIVEVGRSSGSATCVFLEVAARLGCRFISFDLRKPGAWVTSPRAAALIRSGPPGRVALLIRDLARVNPHDVLPAAGRGPTLFFWDDHRAGLGRFLVRRAFPWLRTDPNVVIVHDISDTRGELIGHNRDYLSEGPFESPFRELADLSAFWSDEGIAVRSPAHDVMAFMQQDPDRWERLRDGLPESLSPLIGRGGHWVYFHLPTIDPTARAANRRAKAGQPAEGSVWNVWARIRGLRGMRRDRTLQ